jgi:hypothetical protein
MVHLANLHRSRFRQLAGRAVLGDPHMSPSPLSQPRSPSSRTLSRNKLVAAKAASIDVFSRSKHESDAKEFDTRGVTFAGRRPALPPRDR